MNFKMLLNIFKVISKKLLGVMLYTYEFKVSKRPNVIEFKFDKMLGCSESHSVIPNSKLLTFKICISLFLIGKWGLFFKPNETGVQKTEHLLLVIIQKLVQISPQ